MVADMSSSQKSGGTAQQTTGQTQTAQAKQPDDDSYGLAGAVLALTGF